MESICAMQHAYEQTHSITRDNSEWLRFFSCYEAAMTVLAQRLSEAMGDRGVDQSTLAREIGVTQGAISLILRGKTRQSKYLIDIAIYLGVNYDWLTGRSDQKTPGYESVEAHVTRDDLLLLEQVRRLHNIEQVGLRMLIANRASNDVLPPTAILIPVLEGLLSAIPSGPIPEVAKALAERLPEALRDVGRDKKQ